MSSVLSLIEFMDKYLDKVSYKFFFAVLGMALFIQSFIINGFDIMKSLQQSWRKA